MTDTSPVDQSRVALVGGMLIDGSGRDPVQNAVVLVNGQTIEAVGSANRIKVPSDFQVIDTSGKTVMPGMMDLHVHLCYGQGDSDAWAGGVAPPVMDRPLPMVGIMAFARARRHLQMGFTTLRDVGDVGFLGVSLRDAISGGFVEGPRIVACGPYHNTTCGNGNALFPWLTRNDIVSNVIDGVDEMLKAVRTQIWMNTDWVKLAATGGGTVHAWQEQQFSDEEMQVFISEAHRNLRPVAAHCVQPNGTLATVKLGVDSVEHGVNLLDETIDLMVKQGTFLVPTLSAFGNISEKGLERGVTPERVEVGRRSFEQLIRSTRAARQAGVKIACGTDAGVSSVFHGDSAYELEMLVRRIGMTPMEAIVTATSRSAELLRWSDKVGTVEPNKLADIVVVDGDPLQDIRLLQDRQKIVLVMKDGAVYANRM